MTMPGPPPAMTREEFIDSLWTDERRDDAYKLWDELLTNDGWLDLAQTARAAGDAGNWEPWHMLCRFFASELHFTSDENNWDALVPMVIGGVRTTLRLPL